MPNFLSFRKIRTNMNRNPKLKAIGFHKDLFHLYCWAGIPDLENVYVGQKVEIQERGDCGVS